MICRISENDFNLDNELKNCANVGEENTIKRGI